MQSFSQRKGLKPVKSIMQVDSMDDDLRTGLWNALHEIYWKNAPYRPTKERLPKLSLKLWRDYFRRPLDTLPEWYAVHVQIKQYFFKCEWFEVYDFVEFVANNYPDENETINFIRLANSTMEKELSAYRFVNGVIVQLTSEQEIIEIEQAINVSAPLKPVSTHLKTALDLLSDKQKPDYRNSIKESISGVESLCNLITGGKDTLGDALKRVEYMVAIHAALKKGFSSIYGYTNDASGIRHALLDEPNLDFEDAKYMLVSCSAFINYLVSKAAKVGITF